MASLGFHLLSNSSNFILNTYSILIIFLFPYVLTIPFTWHWILIEMFGE